MCELFGITSVNKVQVNELLKEFFSHSDNHPHGWGMAAFFGNYVSLEKEPTKATESKYLKARLKHPILANDMFAHIRLATIGELEYQNCHPFIKRDNYGRCWTLIHNGTVFKAEKLEKYECTQEGETDSERILFYFIDYLDQKQEELGRPLARKERFVLLEQLICELSPENKLNLLFYDGEYMYAHTNYADSLHYKKIQDGIIIATKPLEEAGWEKMPFTRLMVYKKGNVVFEGSMRSTEYFEQPGQNVAVDGIEYVG